MKKSNMSTNLIQVIKKLYDKATSAVLFNVSIGDWFLTADGVWLGCLLSPTLFSIFLERIMTDALEDHKSTVSIGGRPVTNLHFADDIGGVAERKKSWQNWLSILTKRFLAWDAVQDSTDDSSIEKVEMSLEWQEHFSQFQNKTDALLFHIHHPLCFLIMGLHSRTAKKNMRHGNEVLPQYTMHLIQKTMLPTKKSTPRSRSGELLTQKLKPHLVRTQSWNVLPLKPGVGQYIAIHATLTARDFFLAYFYPSGPFTYIFPKPLLISLVLAVANTWFLCRPAE